MAHERLSDISLAELEELIEQKIDQRLRVLLKPAQKRSVKEINESIRRNRWTPPKDAPTNLELIREDRDG